VNPELSRTLGSRHRAAIGVTEDTDALAVVVSEETGIISLVAGGRIRRELDGRTLKQALLEALDVEEGEEPLKAAEGGQERRCACAWSRSSRCSSPASAWPCSSGT